MTLCAHDFLSGETEKKIMDVGNSNMILFLSEKYLFGSVGHVAVNSEKKIGELLK